MDNIYKSRNSRGGNIITPGDGDAGSLAGSDMSRVLPRQLSTGSTRGVQTVGYGDTKIDGSNNRITIGTPDGGQIGMGSIPGSTTNEYGFFALDSTGAIVWKQVGPTTYVYNPQDGYVNVTQGGILPDSSGGFVVAKPGQNVADAYP